MYGGGSQSRARDQKSKKNVRKQVVTPPVKRFPMTNEAAPTSTKPSSFVPPNRDALLNAHHPNMRKKKEIDPKMLLNVQDYHNQARATLTRNAYDYYASGADDQLTLAENQNYYAKIKLLPKVFIDVSNINTKVSLFNNTQSIDFPVIIAPTAMQRMAHADGELATARAAASLKTIMCTSTLSTTKLEEIINQPEVADTGCMWYQLYILKDRDFTKTLVQRAEASGFKALVVTVDAPRLGNRESDHRNKFSLPDGLSLANLMDDLKKNGEGQTTSALNHYFKNQIDASLTWDDLDWLRGITSLPIIAKGVITPEDAIKAHEKGCAGIVVSNHGARQLDTAISTIEALPAISHALKSINSTCDIFVDGGIRRGTDILKALCLGAKAVLVGRPVLWGLAVNGEQGVKEVLTILKKEFELACMLCGINGTEKCSNDFLLMPGDTVMDKWLRSKL
ncbi:(S)-2-hydroxy-acid oxidase [Acrasis kona]|uniref:(S)-2-hydroxy-acid oxidase n=1 Tax=Acrasis kona TaxID=1008807 RepID=A0AAW2YRQ8_9EUKA